MRQTWTTWPRRVRWPLVSMLVAVLGLGTLYGGYCAGLWGRNTLLLQYLFQCNCPAASEQMRYGEFTVLAPACRWPTVKDMSSDGRYLMITEEAAPRTTYRLDIATGEHSDMQLTNTPLNGFRFLTDDLVLASERASRYALVNWQTGAHVAIRWQYADQLDPPTLDLLRAANQIIVAKTTAVALAPDPLQHPDQNLVLYSTVLSDSILQERLSAFDVTVPLQRLEQPFGDDIGANGLTARRAPLWADRRGIHPANTPTGGDGIVLLRSTNLGYTTDDVPISYLPVGWTTNDAAVVYTSPLRYVIYRKIVFGTLSLLPVPQPVLLLDAPPLPPGGE